MLYYSKHSCLTSIPLIFLSPLQWQTTLTTFWHGCKVKLFDMVPPTQLATAKLEELVKTKNVKPGHIYYHAKRKILCIKCKVGRSTDANSLIKHLETKACFSIARYSTKFEIGHNTGQVSGIFFFLIVLLFPNISLSGPGDVPKRQGHPTCLPGCVEQLHFSSVIYCQPARPPESTL